MAIFLIDGFHLECLLLASLWLSVFWVLYCTYRLGILRLPCFLASIACAWLTIWSFSELWTSPWHLRSFELAFPVVKINGWSPSSMLRTSTNQHKQVGRIFLVDFDLGPIIRVFVSLWGDHFLWNLLYAPVAVGSFNLCHPLPFCARSTMMALRVRIQAHACSHAVWLCSYLSGTFTGVRVFFRGGRSLSAGFLLWDWGF